MASLRSVSVDLTAVITFCMRSISCLRKILRGCRLPIFLSLSRTYSTVTWHIISPGITNFTNTVVEPVLKDHVPHWAQKYGLSRQVVSGDRFSYIEIYVLLPKICGLLRQLVSHDTSLSRQVSLYNSHLIQPWKSPTNSYQ